MGTSTNENDLDPAKELETGADDAKDEAALWDELEQSEAGAAATDDPQAGASPDDESGDAGEGTDAAATDKTGEAADNAAARDAGADDGPGDDGKQLSDGEPSDQAAGKSQETDLWANATPEQRAAHDAAQTQLKKLEQAERSNRGRLSALQRQLNDLTRSDKPAARDDAAAGKDKKGEDTDEFLSSGAWKGFEKEYPEVAGPMGKVFGDMQTQIKRQDKELAAIGTDRREEALDEQYDLLIEQHPDWEQVTDDPELATWLNDQPRHIREAALRNANEIVDAEEAADVVSRFKAHRDAQGDGAGHQGGNGPPAGDADGGKGTTQQPLSGKRKRQLDSASTARTRSPTGVASGIPADGDEETLWKQFDELDRRQGSG